MLRKIDEEIAIDNDHLWFIRQYNLLVEEAKYFSPEIYSGADCQYKSKIGRIFFKEIGNEFTDALFVAVCGFGYFLWIIVRVGISHF